MNAADLLSELVRFPTQQAGPERGAGDERKLCDHLAPLLTARGADRVVVEAARRADGSPGAYVFAHWGTPRRIINAHVDTVPANAGWSRDPWQPHVAEGRLYGLGAADTKGAIAATLIALDRVKPRDFGVLFSGDEEAGSGVLAAFLSTSHATAIREVVVCEPTARAAGIAHRGVLCQTATLLGPGGHSSKADHLPKPLAQLARLAVALDDAGKRRLGDGPEGMKGTCLNIAQLTGGLAFNVIPARGELEWSVRPYPGFDRAGWDREVAALAASVDPAIALATTIDHHPFASKDGSALATRAAPFANRIGPLDFWTEAAMWSAHGADALVIGPGDIHQAHAADEWVALEDLDWAVELFSALIPR
ncbi:MAG: M20 family metallopeptidase [Kofleriaceae bacterium]